MNEGLIAGAVVFAVMVGVGTLGFAALQAIGFAMFSGLKAPQRPSYKTLLGVQVIEILGVTVLGYLLSFVLPSPTIVFSAGVEGVLALLLVAVVVYLLIILLAPLVATVAVVKCSLRQAALSLTLFYVPILLGALFLLYVIVGAASDSGLGRSQDGAQAPTVSTVGEDAAQDANGETQTASDFADLSSRYAQAFCATQRGDLSAIEVLSGLTVEIAQAQDALAGDELLKFMTARHQAMLCGEQLVDTAANAQAQAFSTVGDTATTAEITAASGDGGVSVAVALNPLGDVDFYELTLTAGVGAEDEDSEGDTWLRRIALNTTSAQK